MLGGFLRVLHYGQTLGFGTDPHPDRRRTAAGEILVSGGGRLLLCIQHHLSACAFYRRTALYRFDLSEPDAGNDGTAAVLYAVPGRSDLLFHHCPSQRSDLFCADRRTAGNRLVLWRGTLLPGVCLSACILGGDSGAGSCLFHSASAEQAHAPVSCQGTPAPTSGRSDGTDRTGSDPCAVFCRDCRLKLESFFPF